MSKNEDNLDTSVTVIGNPLEIRLPEHVQMDTPFKTQQETDLQLTNVAIDTLIVGLGQCKSVSGLCRTIDQIMSVMERRRHFMGRPYGHQDKNSKGRTIELLD